MAEYSSKYTVLIQTDIYDSLDSLDSPIGYIMPKPASTSMLMAQVEVIEANIGNYHQFCKAKIDPNFVDSDGNPIQTQPGLTKPIDLEREFIIRSCFLAPTEALPMPELPAKKPQFEVVGEPEEEYVPNPIKIKDAEIGIPYSEGGCVNIVLDSTFTNPADLEDEDNIVALKKEAVEKMVEYYGKTTQSSTQMDEFSRNPFNLVEISDPYFPIRPGKGILLKFCIRNHYFDAFPDRTFEEFSVDNIHKNYIAVNIKASDLENTVNQLAKVLEKYDSDVSKFRGSVTGINFKKLATEFRGFLSKFKKMLSANKVNLETAGESKFEIGFHSPNESAADPCEQKGSYKLEYVLLFDPYGKFLSVGLSNLSKNVSPALAKLIIAHKDVMSASLGGMGWQDLLEQYFGGEFKIDFTTGASKNSSMKKPKSELEAEVKNATSEHADLSIMDYDKNLELSNIKKDPKFKASASELLSKSRDVVGDNFLINLPEILANVDDLTSLYGLVFDKVSIKDLTDLLMEKMTADLNLPDVNEIKLRGILKSLNIDLSLDLVLQFIQTEFEMREFMLAVCEVYEFKKEEIDRIIGMIETPGFPVEFYFFHYKHREFSDPAQDIPYLGGYFSEFYEGDLHAKLEEAGIQTNSGHQSCMNHRQFYQDGNFKISDYFQKEAINKIMCKIFTEGLGKPNIETGNDWNYRMELCGEYGGHFGLPGIESSTVHFDLPVFDFFADLKEDIFAILKTLDKNIIAKAIDLYIKGLFKMSKDFQLDLSLSQNMPGGSYAAGATPGIGSPPAFEFSPGDLFDRFTEIPKISIELDKLSLTKKKMLNKVPNVGIDLEMKKKDVNFSLPSIKSINPSFDFTSFEFGSMGDIFGAAVGAIEDAIVDGIEKGLVNAFKGILNNVLDSLNMDMPNIDSPDFGGLGMNDLLDASNGISADGIANLLLDDLKFDIGKNLNFDPCSEPNISDFVPTAQDIKNMFDDISSAMKPMEVIRVMKGQKNKKDFDNITPAITNEYMKLAITPAVFDKMIDVVADFADTAMLEELEAAYDNKEVMVSVCKDNGIPYCLRDIKETLEKKYSTMSDDQICELIEDIVEETKDSLVDAIGNMKEDFKDSLPFTEDPCSFMPKPKDIPAMNFVNDLTFDTVFDPIKLEYKAEAASFPDMMMQTRDKEEYVKLRLERYDSIITETIVDADTGTFDVELKFVFQEYPDAEYTPLSGDGGIYNQEFGNHYFGPSTPVYYLDGNGNFRKASTSRYKIEEQGDGEIQFSGSYDNLYVKKSEESLQPMPDLRDILVNNLMIIKGARSYETGYLGTATETNTVDREAQRNSHLGYSIKFPGLRTAESRYAFDSNALRESSDRPIEFVFLEEFASSYFGGSAPVREPQIVHDYEEKKGVYMNFPKIESLQNPECVEMDQTPTQILDLSDRQDDYVNSISSSVVTMMHHIVDMKTPDQTITGADTETYIEMCQFLLDGLDGVTSGQLHLLDQKDLIAGITANTAQLYMKSFAKSELFDTNEMLAFVFDTEEIKLFDTESAKNAAKDEYNEKCDFSDNDVSEMRMANIKKLIYLTVRIYVIDVVMQSCFVNSVAYDTEINDYLKEFIFQYMKSQLSNEKDSYYSKFKNFYAETYGQELESGDSYSQSFDKLITEIYADVSKHFSDIFPEASEYTTDAFIENATLFLGDLREFPAALYDTYFASIADPQNNNRFIIQLVGDKGHPHSVTGRREELVKGDTPIKNYSIDTSSGRTVRLRLCYVADFRDLCHNEDLRNGGVGYGERSNVDIGGSSSIIGRLGLAHEDSDGDPVYGNHTKKIAASLNKYPYNFMNLDLSVDAEQSISQQLQTLGAIPELGGIIVQKLPELVSYNYVYELGDDPSLYPHLVCIPLAETKINGNNTYSAPEDPAMPASPSFFGDPSRAADLNSMEWKAIFPKMVEFFDYYTDIDNDFQVLSTQKNLEHLYLDAVKEVARKSSHSFGLNDFIIKRLRSESYFDLIKRCMISKMQQIKPETALIFQDTKDAIRRAILVISQEKENFDYIDQYPAAIQDIQSAGVGTNPDFSPKAKKMALMTVPLIIKGMAEMFDPNTKLASLIRKGATLSGVNLSPPVASLMALPFNIIPFAPGPPITPLGLTYLATSFLEPKERKELSDIKRGKNRNPEADPVTGLLPEGTPQEQIEQRNERAEEAVRRSTRVHMGISKLCRTFATELHRQFLNIYEHSRIGFENDSNETNERLINLKLGAMYSGKHAQGMGGHRPPHSRFYFGSESVIDYTGFTPYYINPFNAADRKTGYHQYMYADIESALDLTRVLCNRLYEDGKYNLPKQSEDPLSLPAHIDYVYRSFAGHPEPDYDSNYDPKVEGEALQLFFKRLEDLIQGSFKSSANLNAYRFNRTLLTMLSDANYTDESLGNDAATIHNLFRFEEHDTLRSATMALDGLYYITIRSVAYLSYALADFLILEDQYVDFRSNGFTIKPEDFQDPTGDNPDPRANHEFIGASGDIRSSVLGGAPFEKGMEEYIRNVRLNYYNQYLNKLPNRAHDYNSGLSASPYYEGSGDMNGPEYRQFVRTQFHEAVTARTEEIALEVIDRPTETIYDKQFGNGDDANLGTAGPAPALGVLSQFITSMSDIFGTNASESINYFDDMVRDYLDAFLGTEEDE